MDESLAPPLPLSALPVWATLNGIHLPNAAVRNSDADSENTADRPKRGLGLFAQRAVSPRTDASRHDESAVLLRVPVEVVLSETLVEEYAKAEGEFRQLLDAVGQRSPRMDILLFLLTQLLRARAQPTLHASAHRRLPAPTPWAEYVRLLPRTVPLPTLWPPSSTALLRGTSLEPAVAAKLRALEDEFAHLEAATQNLPFWDDLLWQGSEPVALCHWVLLDAWFRSRALELPRLGTCMVPVLDMANHAAAAGANAYYDVLETADEGECVVLLARPGCAPRAGDELTISYGDDKSSAEMLFSYGFIDTTTSSSSQPKSMTLPVSSIVLDDPLAKVKTYAFSAAPTLTLTQRTPGDVPAWTCPFAYLAVLNHEDGLNFQILRSAAEDSVADELRVFWQDDDVTERAGEFGRLIAGHALEKVFELRVRAALRGVLEEQLGRMEGVQPQGGGDEGKGDEGRWAEMLRTEQVSLVRGVMAAIEGEIGELVEDKDVRRYLASQQGGEGGEEGDGDGGEGEGIEGIVDDDEFA